MAAKIAKDFKVSEKRHYWLRCTAHADAGEWGALELLAKERKPPIGFEAFVSLAVDRQKPSEARKYVSRVASVEERGRLYVKLQMFPECIALATETRNPALLQAARDAAAAATDRQAVAQLDAALGGVR